MNLEKIVTEIKSNWLLNSSTLTVKGEDLEVELSYWGDATIKELIEIINPFDVGFIISSDRIITLYKHI